MLTMTLIRVRRLIGETQQDEPCYRRMTTGVLTDSCGVRLCWAWLSTVLLHSIYLLNTWQHRPTSEFHYYYYCYCYNYNYYYYHYYNCFMALGILSRTTRVSQHQKGKCTSLDLLEQEIVSGSGISWAIRKSAQRPRHNHASIPPLSFLQAGCSSCWPTNSW